ncbi:hypothetical protein LTR62_004819 [Meristemomyces frigidus]|uniref:NAD(P)-binding protein n=1 Tax=Meristemomyces frigidus TaxID=1508187 RepID=A0AAN7TQ75_9PEZI|nr:hypothetical protein LTR62_004819 [Meristemomyces frigidus]
MGKPLTEVFSHANMANANQLKIDLYDRFSVAGIPIYYMIPLYRAWASTAAQIITSALGTGILIYLSYSFVSYLWELVRPSVLQKYCHVQTGSWALVTGANDGIGRAFADELLERGFNVLLHGRNEEKLKRVQAELAAKFPRRKLDYVVADASSYDRPERSVVEKVENLPGGGKLTILINNVGGVNTSPQYCSLKDMRPADIDTQINLNSRFPTHLTSALLPLLHENKPALIINAGSAAGVFGVPYIAPYSATKGYIFALTKALASELVADGWEKDIEVMSLIINNTRSAGNTAEMPLFTIDAKDCAKGALSRVGSGCVTVYPNWRHAVQGTVMALLPEKQFMAMMGPEMKKRKLEELGKVKSL